MKYTVPFNRHRFIDLSDAPRRGYKIVEADSANNAWDIVCEWRERNRQYGIVSSSGKKFYIGLIHQAEERDK